MDHSDEIEALRKLVHELVEQNAALRSGTPAGSDKRITHYNTNLHKDEVLVIGADIRLYLHKSKLYFEAPQHIKFTKLKTIGTKD